MLYNNEVTFLEIDIEENFTKEYINNIDLFIKHMGFKIIKIGFNLCSCIGEIIEIIESIIYNNNDKIFLLPKEYFFINKINVKYYIEIDFNRSYDNISENIDYIYFHIDRNFELVNLINIINKIDKKVKFIPRFDENINIRDYVYFINDITNNNIPILFDIMYKDYLSVFEHPCNMYICNGNNCHSNKNNYPRYLKINSSGINPYGLVNSIYTFGNFISDLYIESVDDLMKNYKDSLQYYNFIKANKLIYKNYIITQVLKIFPWNLMLNIIKDEILG